MLLDLPFANLFVENLGTSIENLLNFTNLVVFSVNSFTFTNYLDLINLIILWPTEAQFDEAVATVLFAYYWHHNYWDALKEVYSVIPHLYALDYFHLFYLKQIMYKSYLSMYSHSLTTVTKPILINLHLDIFSSSLFNKWSYALCSFGITFLFSHVMKFRLQYGFNFYFNYFKVLSDLGEQEYGSYDDFKFFLFLLIQMIVWFCWVFFIAYTFSLQSESKLMLVTFSVMLLILTIPVRLLWDFGLAFGMYVRGAASSTNLVVEAFFDLIGVIIIFTRFIVQNIRFLMVFVAFFELFEWTSTSVESSYMLKWNINLYNDVTFFSNLTAKSILLYIIFSLKLLFIYLYHLLHLIIVSFMQIGVYLMVSFWLFFFLYTSFFKLTSDSYFSVKRNLNVV